MGAYGALKSLRNFQEPILTLMACDFKKRRVRLNQLVGKHKYASCQVGFEGGLAVIAAENAVFPDEQIGVAVRKLFPFFARRERHALADQEEICAGDGFIV